MRLSLALLLALATPAGARDLIVPLDLPSRLAVSPAGISGVVQLAGDVVAVLTPDLLKPEWREKAVLAGSPVMGHCYAASEALYHMLGGKEAGWTPTVLHHEGATHWFLRHQSGIILDATASQFKTAVPYDEARGSGFLTAEPSARAREIIRRAKTLRRKR